MCLIIELESTGIPRREAGSVSKGLRKELKLTLYAQRMPKEVVGSSFLLGAGTERCACALLAKDADTDAREFVLKAKSVLGLETALRYFSNRVGSHGFSVRASWHGEAREVPWPHTLRVVTLDSFLKAVRAGKMGNNVTYQVKGMPPNQPLNLTGAKNAPAG
jgi:hypothetical protein